jgi:hypothetical protein
MRTAHRSGNIHDGYGPASHKNCQRDQKFGQAKAALRFTDRHQVLLAIRRPESVSSICSREGSKKPLGRYLEITLTPKEGQLPQGQGEQVMGACTLGRIEGFSMSIELNMCWRI